MYADVSFKVFKDNDGVEYAGIYKSFKQSYFYKYYFERKKKLLLLVTDDIIIKKNPLKNECNCKTKKVPLMILLTHRFSKKLINTIKTKNSK